MKFLLRGLPAVVVAIASVLLTPRMKPALGDAQTLRDLGDGPVSALLDSPNSLNLELRAVLTSLCFLRHVVNP